MQQYTSIVITGASSGIGAALAKAYAAPGITLGLIARDKSRLEQISAECRNRGATVEWASIEVTDRDRLVHWLRDFHRDAPVDLLIANAGITCSLSRQQVHEPIDEINRVMETNFTGVINSVLPVIELMQKQNHGHIAVMSSLSAFQGIPNFPAYSASKAALFSYFQAIRGKLELNNISLSVICPGFIQTNMTAQLSGMKMMVIPVDRAAAVIQKAMGKRTPLVVFPTLLRLGIWVSGLLPTKINTLIYNKLFGIRK